MSVLRVTALICAFGVAGVASAATFNVDNFNDLNDAAAGNGVCDVGDGSCSFRAAVQEANALDGHDTILLAAGTYNLTQTYVCGGCGPATYGLYLDIRLGVDIIGEGVGVTFIKGQDINYSGPVFQVSVQAGGNSSTRLSDLSIDPGTFAGFGGDYSNQVIGLVNYSCASCKLTLERVELNVHHTSDAGGSSPLSFGGIGPAEVLDSTLNVTGGASISPTGIQGSGGVPLLVEDFTVNGGNSMGTGVSYTAYAGEFGGPNTLAIRRSRFLNMSSSGYATILLANINVPAQIQAQIEDVEVTGGGPGVFVRHYGTGSQTTHLNIERSLFAGMSSQALRLAGPCIASINNSTISAAGTGVQLIAAESGGTGTCDVDLDSVTIAGGGTSVAVGSGLGTISARNSILADASTAACTGSLDSLGHNLIEGSCSVAGDTTGNISGMDPMLDLLADNGGFTHTHALQGGSPAIDVGDAANCPARDQRHYARPADGDGDMDARCDIGAFEKDAVAAPGNTAPVAGDDSAFVDEDDGLILGAGSLQVNDVDAEDDPLLISSTDGTTGQGAGFSCGASGCSYNPVDDFFGSDSFEYEVCDDGMPALCDTATVTVTVNAVNDAPSFLPGPAQVFGGGSSGPQSSSGWASSIELGPNESGQLIQAFELTLQSDPDGVVSSLPTINAAGDLAFTLSGTPGEASFEVRLRDDGGTANGGTDLSAATLLSIAAGTAADVSVSIQQCSTQAAPGEFYAYALRIENAGPNTALDVVLDAPLPAGASIDSIGNGDCMDSGGSVSCHVVQLLAGEGIAVPVQLLMPGGGSATLDLLATVTAASDDPVANNGASATVMLVPGLILDTGFESCDGYVD